MVDMMNTPKLNAALAKAVGVIESIPLDGTLDTGADKGRKRIQFDYATAEGILAAIRAPLACEGISVCLIDSDFVEGRAAVRVTLRVAHSSGESFVMSKVRPIDRGGSEGTAYDRSETIAVKRLLKSLLLIPAVEEQEEQHGAKTQGSVVESSPVVKQRVVKAAPAVSEARPAESKVVDQFVKQVNEAASSFTQEHDAEFQDVEEQHERQRERMDLSDDSPAPRDEVIATLRRVGEDFERLGTSKEDRKALFMEWFGPELVGDKGPIISKFTRNHLVYARQQMDTLKQRTLEEVVA